MLDMNRNGNRTGRRLTAAECARRTGLTVKSLRLYERHGLLTPDRSGKDWRLYGPRELARINEIIALKQIGIGLAAMRPLLGGMESDIPRLLDLQERTLIEHVGRVERGLAIVRALQGRARDGRPISLEDLVQLAKETNMTETMTDTIAWKRYQQARPRSRVAIDAATLADLAGCYAIMDHYGGRVTADGGRLLIRLIGQPPIELVPEGDDSFFIEGEAEQVVFRRDGTGEVVALLWHREGVEWPCPRISDAALEAIEQRLAERVRDNRPDPRSEAIIRGIVKALLSGRAGGEYMVPQQAALSEAMLPLSLANIDVLGPVKAMRFLSVGMTGEDIFEVEHQQGGRRLVQIALTPEGLATMLKVQPL